METNEKKQVFSSKWKEITTAFKDNPINAKDLYALPLAVIKKRAQRNRKGYSWFNGNCVITKECVAAAAKHIGIAVEFIKKDSFTEKKKHYIEFKINNVLCIFDRGNAIAKTQVNDTELIEQFFGFFYPDNYITIEK